MLERHHHPNDIFELRMARPPVNALSPELLLAIRDAVRHAPADGARAIVLKNQKGAILELSGRQTGLMANADLSGLAISLK